MMIRDESMWIRQLRNAIYSFTPRFRLPIARGKIAIQYCDAGLCSGNLSSLLQTLNKSPLGSIVLVENFKVLRGGLLILSYLE